MNRVVYLHGFASGPSSSKARYFRSCLETAGMRVDVPDLAAGDFEHLTLTGQMAVVERTARPAGREEAVALIGSSMGGYLAALYAARHPEVTRLVLLAPAFGFARRWPERLGAAAMERWRETRRMEVFHYGEGQSRSLSYNLIEDAAQFEDAPDFSQPALIFHGAHDDVVPPDLSRAFAAAHPNVTLEIVDSGHELLNVLDYMARKVGAFLATPSPR
jgi:pimeloyl-ACP methyl ester carboxylesterase